MLEVPQVFLLTTHEDRIEDAQGERGSGVYISILDTNVHPCLAEASCEIQAYAIARKTEKGSHVGRWPSEIQTHAGCAGTYRIAGP